MKERLKAIRELMAAVTCQEEELKRLKDHAVKLLGETGTVHAKPSGKPESGRSSYRSGN